MRSGITRHALRRHRWSFVGPAATQALAAGVIAVMVMTATSVGDALATRGRVRSAASADAVETMTVFVGVSIYMSLLIVGVTMSLAARRQVRDIALLRAIGAAPAQIRRSIALQAAIVAVPASVLGFLLAVPAGVLWTVMLKGHGVLPDEVHFAPRLSALPIVVGIEVLASLAGGFVASSRTARIPPAAALTETAVGRRSAPVRTFAGLALVVAGCVLSVALARLAPDQAGDAAFFVMLAECVGAGLLGPRILRLGAAALRPVLPPGVSRIAVDNVTVLAGPLSGALVPLVLSLAFAIVKVAGHTTTTAVTGVAAAAPELWGDYAGTAIYSAFAAVAALNCFITVQVGRGRDLALLQLLGGDRVTLVRMAAVEAAIVAGAAVSWAVAVAAVTLMPILHTSLDVWLPRIPVQLVAAGFALVAAVVAAGMVAPAAVLMQHPATQVDRISG
jgi:putative ABC transport system permease protein